MKKIKQGIIRCLVVMLAVLVLVGCSTKVNPTQKIAEDLQTTLPALATQKIGALNITSAKEYYASELDYWTKAKAMTDLPKKYTEGVNAEFTIATFMTAELENTEVKSTYLGAETETNVEGIFIYEFPNAIPFGTDVVTEANALTKELIAEENYGEYFYVKGKYLVTIDSSIPAEEIESIFKSLDTIIVE